MIKLGVIGYGGRSNHIVNTIKLVEPETQLVGIIDDKPERVKTFLNDNQSDVPFYASIDDMVKATKLNGIIIGTDCDSHTNYAIQASKYDIPIFLEKPVSINMEQAIQLEEAFTNSKAPVVVSFPLRLSHFARYAKDKIQQGLIGKPEHIMAWNYPAVGTNYFDRPERNFPISGGLFLQKATHDLDCMLYLMGQKVKTVAAMWTRGHIFGGDMPKGLTCGKCDKATECPESPKNRLHNKGWNATNSGGRVVDHQCVFGKDIGDLETGMNEDSSSVLLEFENGSHGIYTQVFYARRAKTRGVRISGYEGTLDFDWHSEKMKIIAHHDIINEQISADDSAGHFGGDAELAYDFVNVINSKKNAIRAGIWEGIQSVYACLAARESAQTGKYVSVRQVGQVN